MPEHTERLRAARDAVHEYFEHEIAGIMTVATTARVIAGRIDEVEFDLDRARQSIPSDPALIAKLERSREELITSLETLAQSLAAGGERV